MLYNGVLMVECRCGRMGRLKLLDAHGNELGAAKATDLVEGARVKYTYTCVHAPGNLGNLVPLGAAALDLEAAAWRLPGLFLNGCGQECCTSLG